jgi:hypothetical protein
MLVVISCPHCGHLGRVPEGRIGHKVRCKGCGKTFRPEAALAQPSPEGLRGGKESSAEAPPKSGWLGVFKRPAVIDGAISGAVGGVLTGILMGAINGGLSGKVSGGVLAGVIGGGMTGFIKGFLCGAPLGGVLGLLASYISGPILAASRRRALLTGMVVGAGVTAVIAHGSPGMIVLGMLPGALGSGFWSILESWEQAADKPFISGFQVEEETSPEARASEGKESLSEELRSWRVDE